MRTCVVIPVYNHAQVIGTVAAAIRAHGLHCILVDDGSEAGCARVLDQLAAQAPDAITLLRHPQNRGKGAAVITGMQHAAATGYSHALQIDADGQHDCADIPRFVQLAQQHPLAVIAGCPIYDDSVPALRFYARYLTHIWVWINTLSLEIKDSMCGFRLYPLTPVMRLISTRKIGAHMDFDTEILVRLYWAGAQVINVPTRVGYPLDGVSHFRAVQDNLLITRMHAVLFAGMLLRSPRLLARNVRRHWPRRQP